MTVDELLAREQIRHTLASYTMAGDRAKADEVANVFTEDGVLEFDGGQGLKGFRHAGRQAIEAFFRGTPAPAAEPLPAGQRRFLRHNLTTCLIDLTGLDTAKSRTYFIVFSPIGADHSGYYADTLKKIGERWLIAHRGVRLDWIAPNSVMAAR